MQGFARQREVGFAERLGQGRMRVHQVRDVVGGRLPVVDQLCLTDELTDPISDEMDSHDGSVGPGTDNLHPTRRLEDAALAVATQVVDGGGDVTVPLDGLGLGQPDRSNLGVGVGDAGNPTVRDRHTIEAGQ